MLVLLYLAITGIVVPQVGAILMGAFEPVMIIFIIIAGLVLTFSAVGVRISNNLGSTVVGGLMRGLGYICRSIIQGIGWLFRQIALFLPRIYRGSGDAFIRAGMGQTVSRILGVVAATLALVIII